MGDGYTITGWRVFSPGVWKESAEYFSPKSIQQIADNFKRFSHLPVVGKLGHDRQQRYRESLGLPALGRVTSLHAEPDGTLVFDRVTGIPRIVASAIRSGFLPGVSIELAPRPSGPGRRIIRDPKDPSAPISGDILTGFALLGEELPAVPGYETPVPVDERGHPAPPLSDADQRWWLENMSQHLAHPAGSPADKDDSTDDAAYSARVIAFSALTFTPGQPHMDQQLAALGLTPEQIQGVLALVGTPAPEPSPAPAPPPVEDHPAFKAFAAEMADLKKNFGAISEKLTAGEKEKDEACMSAMTSRVESAIKEKNLAQKVAPVALPAVRDQLLGILTSKTFSATADRDAAFGSALDVYAALPVNPMLKDAAADTKPAGSGGLSDFQKQILNSESVRRHAPRVAATLLTAK